MTTNWCNHWPQTDAEKNPVATNWRSYTACKKNLYLIMKNVKEAYKSIFHYCNEHGPHKHSLYISNMNWIPLIPNQSFMNILHGYKLVRLPSIRSISSCWQHWFNSPRIFSHLFLSISPLSLLRSIFLFFFLFYLAFSYMCHDCKTRWNISDVSYTRDIIESYTHKTGSMVRDILFCKNTKETIFLQAWAYSYR